MKRIVFRVLFFLLWIGNVANVFPCSCAGYTEREKFRKADYVFLGEVLDIADSGQDYFIYAVTFRIEKQWKGSKRTELIVNFDFDDPGMCGDLNLAKGKEF